MLQGDRVMEGEGRTAEVGVPVDGQTPRGTLAVLMLYAGVIVLLWGYGYLMLILRR